MHSVHLISDHLIRQGFDPSMPGDSDLLCPMRLQKLLYYTQGFSLAMTDKPLFRETLQAWKYGPVVPEVYRRFTGLGSGTIPVDPEKRADPVDFLTRDIIRSVWGLYGKYSASRLSKMTHVEPPWVTARNGVARDEPSSSVISHDSLRDYFRDHFRNWAIRNHLPDPCEDWQADYDPATAVSLEDFKSEMQKVGRV